MHLARTGVTSRITSKQKYARKIILKPPMITFIWSLRVNKYMCSRIMNCPLAALLHYMYFHELFSCFIVELHVESWIALLFHCYITCRIMNCRLVSLLHCRIMNCPLVTWQGLVFLRWKCVFQMLEYRVIHLWQWKTIHGGIVGNCSNRGL